MVTVRVVDLLKKAQELMNAGYEYVDIDELDADEDMPKCLHFEAYDESLGCGIDFEDLDHIELSD